MDIWREKKKERPGGKGRREANVESREREREIGKSTRSGKGTNRRDDLNAVRARGVYFYDRCVLHMARMCVCTHVYVCVSRVYGTGRFKRHTYTRIHVYGEATHTCARARAPTVRAPKFTASTAYRRVWLTATYREGEKACDATRARASETVKFSPRRQRGACASLWEDATRADRTGQTNSSG